MVCQYLPDNLPDKGEYLEAWWIVPRNATQTFTHLAVQADSQPPSGHEPRRPLLQQASDNRLDIQAFKINICLPTPNKHDWRTAHVHHAECSSNLHGKQTVT